MAQHHKYSISDVEDMMPFERDIFIEMIMDHIEKQKEQMEKG
jgi:hypothetical protein